MTGILEPNKLVITLSTVKSSYGRYRKHPAWTPHCSTTCNNHSINGSVPTSCYPSCGTDIWCWSIQVLFSPKINLYHTAALCDVSLLEKNSLQITTQIYGQCVVNVYNVSAGVTQVGRWQVYCKHPAGAGAI